MTGTITPYRSGQRPGRDGFPQLLRAEWTKFRTVRGWVIGMVAAALLTALAVAGRSRAALQREPERPASVDPAVAIGPGGEAVTDNFYFVHQSLDGDGSITARVTSLDTELLTPGGGSPPQLPCPGPRPESSSRRAPGQDRLMPRSWPPPPTACGCSTTTPTTGRPARRRLRGVAALAAADPFRRHDHRI